jgi:hypothetical protein
MSGSIPPLPSTPLWRGTRLKKEAEGKFYLLLDGSEWAVSRPGRFALCIVLRRPDVQYHPF